VRRQLLVGLSFLLLVVPTLATGASRTSAEHPVGDTTFSETGFTVPAVFMQYWQSHGGLAIFGYPISPVRTEGDYQVQYFERNRFELHPENKGTAFEVELGLLGNVLTADRAFYRATPFIDTPTRRYFAQTGHSLGGVFLQYWNTQGGLDLFGYPISEELIENGYTVQYFERNRFELHPENQGTAFEVLLGLLGRDYLALVDKGKVPTPPAKAPPDPAKAGTPGGSPPAPPKPPAPGATPTTPWEAPPAWPEHTYGPPPNYPPAPYGPFLTGPHVGYGIIVDMYYKDHNRILNAVQDAGFTWVKQQAQWKDIEGPQGSYQWGELDNIVRDVTARGLHLMISVVKAPDWATGGKPGFPNDPEDFGRFMRAMAKHYQGQVSAYELWNEENLIGESGVISPERYFYLLKAGYLGVKAGDPSAVVIMGALTPTGIHDPNLATEDTVFLDSLYRVNNGEIRNYFDVLGSHPYGYNNPPETMWPDNPSTAREFTTHGQFYYRRVENQRQVMENFGEGQKQIWVTEWGWCSDFRPDGYNECAQNTLDDQASYIVRAYQMSKEKYPWMGVTFLWNLNFSTFQDWYTGPAHFSLLNGDWSTRPAFNAIKNYIRGTP
jgi:hypothetical protein